MLLGAFDSCFQVALLHEGKDEMHLFVFSFKTYSTYKQKIF